MLKPKASRIGYRTADGGISDIKLHEEIMAGVDDTPLRVQSAYRCMRQFGMTREQVEELFDVTLPSSTPPES